MTRRPAAAVVMALVVAACGGGSPVPPAETGGDSLPETEGADAAGTYERAFVFVSVDQDSAFIVPWLMSATETPDSVDRRASAWLVRGGTWEQFYDDTWATPPTRVPARVLPHGSATFVVRDGDAIDGIIFDEGPRNLELVLGDVTATFVGPRGEAIELLKGAAYLSEQRVDGAVLDLARASAEGSIPGGDWAFLLSGDSARFVLAADTEHGGETEPSYRGWADLGNETLQWPELRADWRDAQAFPPARRDVPVSWRVWSVDGTVEGELEAVSSDIRAAEGPGPLLPVRALVEVVGAVETERGRFPVRGLFVHERR